MKIGVGPTHRAAKRIMQRGPDAPRKFLNQSEIRWYRTAKGAQPTCPANSVVNERLSVPADMGSDCRCKRSPRPPRGRSRAAPRSRTARRPPHCMHPVRLEHRLAEAIGEGRFEIGFSARVMTSKSSCTCTDLNDFSQVGMHRGDSQRSMYAFGPGCGTFLHAWRLRSPLLSHCTQNSSLLNREG